MGSAGPWSPCVSGLCTSDGHGHQKSAAREDGVMVEDCPFCSVDPTEVIALEGSCLAIRTGEPPEGSLMILPAAHRVAPWDLTAAEWDDTGTLLRSLSDRLLDSHRPDG